MSVGRPGWARIVDLGLEVDVLGSGEPVVVIQTALDADELRPLAELVAKRRRHRVVFYHRRGYAGSTPARDGHASIARDAGDCRELMTALSIAPAHVVGASYSAAVAMTLASSAPEFVRTLTVIEPPPAQQPGAQEFRTANALLLETLRAGGALVALDQFMTMLVGTDWRAESDRIRAGTVSAMERDAVTFFGNDVPALLSWDFGADEAAKVTCPMLYIGGADTGSWFAQMRTYTLDLLPHAESTVLAAAGHLVASTHPVQTAQRVVEFLDRHV